MPDRAPIRMSAEVLYQTIVHNMDNFGQMPLKKRDVSYPSGRPPAKDLMGQGPKKSK